MPAYDYKCNACNELMEITHSITEDARKECPKCGASALVRLISKNVGVSFKGTGFYINDSKSSGASSN